MRPPGLDDSVGHFVHPFLTLFLTRKLGMGPLEAGFYVTLSALAWVPSSLAGGKIADSFGRKKVLVAAAVCLLACALGCGAAWSTASLVFFRWIGGVGRGSRLDGVPALHFRNLAGPPARAPGHLVQLAISIGILPLTRSSPCVCLP